MNVVRLKKIQSVFLKNERVLIPAMLVLGVGVDFVTFRSIKISSVFTILGLYAIVAAGAIAFINIYKDKWLAKQSRVFRYLRVVAPLVIQFTFGALLSASLIFYWFSGALSVSWPFILVIAILIASNDVLREYYLKPIVQISVYYFALSSLLSLILPFLFNSISAWVFVTSGLLALAIVGAYVKKLSALSRTVSVIQTRLLKSMVIIFLSLNVLYFLNIIPPIPLSLREADVYHSLQRTDNAYVIQDEQQSFLERITPGKTVHMLPGKTLSAYSAIFAPLKLNTAIVHKWERYDTDSKTWEEQAKLQFSISGGRDEGYRGFSRKTIGRSGTWRVSVETLRGQTLGRFKFNVIFTSDNVELVEIIK